MSAESRLSGQSSSEREDARHLATPADYQPEFRRRWLYVPLESALIAGTVVVLAYVLDAGGTNASATEYWAQIASLGREEFRSALIQLQTIFASIMLGVIFVRRSRLQPGEMTREERLRYLMLIGQREAIIEGIVLYVAILSGAATILYGISTWVTSMTEANMATGLYVMTVAFIAVPVILYLLTGAIEVGEVAATRRYAVILTSLRRLALWRGALEEPRRNAWAFMRFYLSAALWSLPALFAALLRDHDRELARPMITVVLLAVVAGLAMLSLMPRVIAGSTRMWRSVFWGFIALISLISLQGMSAIVTVTADEPWSWRGVMVLFSALSFLAILYRLLLLSGALRPCRERTRRWIEQWVAYEVQRRSRDFLEEAEEILSDGALEPDMRALVREEFVPDTARVRPIPSAPSRRSRSLRPLSRGSGPALLEPALEPYLPEQPIPDAEPLASGPRLTDLVFVPRADPHGAEVSAPH